MLEDNGSFCVWAPAYPSVYTRVCTGREKGGRQGKKANSLLALFYSSHSLNAPMQRLTKSCHAAEEQLNGRMVLDAYPSLASTCRA